MSITFSFAWYDLWIGAYLDTKKRRVYVCPLPCLLFTIQLAPEPTPYEPSPEFPAEGRARRRRRHHQNRMDRYYRHPGRGIF